MRAVAVVALWGLVSLPIAIALAVAIRTSTVTLTDQIEHSLLRRSSPLLQRRAWLVLAVVAFGTAGFAASSVVGAASRRFVSDVRQALAPMPTGEVPVTDLTTPPRDPSALISPRPLFGPLPWPTATATEPPADLPAAVEATPPAPPVVDLAAPTRVAAAATIVASSPPQPLPPLPPPPPPAPPAPPVDVAVVDAVAPPVTAAVVASVEEVEAVRKGKAPKARGAERGGPPEHAGPKPKQKR